MYENTNTPAYHPGTPSDEIQQACAKLRTYIPALIGTEAEYTLERGYMDNVCTNTALVFTDRGTKFMTEALDAVDKIEGALNEYYNDKFGL